MPQNGFGILNNSADRRGEARHTSRRSVELGLPAYDEPARTYESKSVAVTPPKPHRESVSSGASLSVGHMPFTPSSQWDSSTVSSPLSLSDRDESVVPFPSLQPLQSALQATAPSFGPSIASTLAAPSTGLTSVIQTLNQQQQQQQQQPSSLGFGSSPYPTAHIPFQSSRSQRPRADTGEFGQQFSRFSNVPLEQYIGDLYALCKDQHGCRYLQRKLEEKNPVQLDMIFTETCPHVVELMTDPFGNYLCQKLLEYSNDTQRTALIRNAAPQLVQIALNQHGTRALQKMIEFISTSEQTQMVIVALRDHVVELVKDLNGNHVIQKCLNRLAPADAQFIYDAVGQHCIEVGTHRHGCCVLQRCIDHASGEQKAHLIQQITANAFALVQDPFGNYVVQYILDLSEPYFTEPICRKFAGRIPTLSKQKFSSNVIEKCIRTADSFSRRHLIDEMLPPVELHRMLTDSFANYVVQTAIDFADGDTRARLIDAIRPILPSIRQTPHGRRIAGKMVSLESGGGGGHHHHHQSHQQQQPHHATHRSAHSIPNTVGNNNTIASSPSSSANSSASAPSSGQITPSDSDNGHTAITNGLYAFATAYPTTAATTNVSPYAPKDFGSGVITAPIGHAKSASSHSSSSASTVAGKSDSLTSLSSNGGSSVPDSASLFCAHNGGTANNPNGIFSPTPQGAPSVNSIPPFLFPQ